MDNQNIHMREIRAANSTIGRTSGSKFALDKIFILQLGF
jgi:hypothetical protein